MTDEQRKMVEDNHNLIYSFLKKYNLSIEEWYGMAAIGLCKAAIGYDETRGGWTFATYAYKCMSNSVFHEMRRAYAAKAIPEGLVFFYHDISHESDSSGDTLEFLDMIPDKTDVADEVTSKMLYEKCRSKLSDQELLILEMTNMGYKQREIAEAAGCYQSDVSRILKRIRRKFGWLNC